MQKEGASGSLLFSFDTEPERPLEHGWERYQGLILQFFEFLELALCYAERLSFFPRPFHYREVDYDSQT